MPRRYASPRLALARRPIEFACLAYGCGSPCHVLGPASVMFLCSSAGFAGANLGEVRKGGAPPSERNRVRSGWLLPRAL